jgi:hypothetical protein
VGRPEHAARLLDLEAQVLELLRAQRRGAASDVRSGGSRAVAADAFQQRAQRRSQLRTVSDLSART